MSKKKGKKSGSERRFDKFMENIGSVGISKAMRDYSIKSIELGDAMKVTNIPGAYNSIGKDHTLNDSGYEWE